VEAAVTMRERLSDLNRRRMKRLQYTAIGDAVNVAARLESLTKENPDFPILINEATADALRNEPEIGLKALGPFHVKGRAENPVRRFTNSPLVIGLVSFPG